MNATSSHCTFANIAAKQNLMQICKSYQARLLALQRPQGRSYNIKQSVSHNQALTMNRWENAAYSWQST